MNILSTKRILCTALFIVVIAAAFHPVTSQGSPLYENWKVYLEGFWACGEMNTIAARSDTVYFNAGRVIAALGLNDPSNPILLGNYDNSPYEIESVYLRQNVLLTIDDGSYFSILNVTDPTIPYLVGQTDLGSELRDLDISGDYAYVATFEGMSIVDISNLSAPSEVTTLGSSWNSNTILIDGSFAYIGTADSGLKVVDVSVVTAPNEVASLSIEGGASDIDISGNYAYILTQMDSLMVIDISDPYNPQRVGAAFTIDSPVDVKVLGSYAYVAALWAGLLVFDISSPSNPALVQTIPTDDFPYSLAIDGSKIYVASSREGVLVFDITDPSSPTEIARYGVGDNLWAVDVSDTLAYVVDRIFWFRVVDVSTPENILELGAVRFEGQIEDLVANGNYIYTIGDSFWVVNCTNPQSPTVVGKFATAGRGIDISGDYLYIGSYSTLDIFSISDPANPSYVTFFNPSTSVSDVAVSGNYAYLACYQTGVIIVDISDPSAPSLVTTFDTPGSAVGVDVSGNYLLVADSAGGLRIVDISDPHNPIEAGFFNNGGNISEVTASQSRAFIIDGMASLRVIDFSTPSSPVEVGYFTSFGYMHGAPIVVGDIVYQTDFMYGLGILDCSEAVSTLLQGISVALDDSRVTVKWELASEEGIESFIIARRVSSLEGKPEEIAEIDAEGLLKYTFFDTDIEPGSSYTYELYALKKDGTRMLLASKDISTGNIPPITLSQNYPNPFNPVTTISFYLMEDSEVELGVYDVSGRLVKTLVHGRASSGWNRVVWDGKNKDGRSVCSGVYLYILKADKKVLSRRMVLLR